MKKHLLIFTITLLTTGFLFAQPTRLEGDLGAGWSNYNLTDRGTVGAVRVLASTTNATTQFVFNNILGDYNPQWCGSNAPNVTRALNSRLNGSAFHYTGGGWNQNLKFNMTDTRYYTFIIGENTASNNDMSILETTYNPNTISALSISPSIPDNSETGTVTATLSGVLNINEYVFIRYSTDAWSTSSLVAMSFVSGTDYSGQIPIQTTGTTVTYYVLTSNNNSFATTDSDYFTLELDNNTGSNYSYTVTEAPYRTAQDGDWNTTSTWLCGCIPPADAKTEINHDITVNGTVADNPKDVEITTGNSVTFGASGDITTNSLITNNGTIDMGSGGILRIADGATLANNATFSAGIGEVCFTGIATVSGTIRFYNASLSGAVNFGGSSSIDNTLQLYGGGFLDFNSIIYNSGSTLKFTTDYILNSGDKSWYSNVASSGAPQEGIPYNLEIPIGVKVSLNDNAPSSINGNILINGTFELSTSSGGDFKLRGNFTNNGTFTPNDREVTFNGTSNQNLLGITTFDYLKMDGSGGLTLNNSITVNKTLTFTNGKIILGANNITLDAVAGAVSGGNSASYAVTAGTGYFIQDVGAVEKTFPVGTVTSFAPAFLTQAGTQEDLYVQVKQNIDNPTINDDYTVNLQWTIDEETTGSNSITTKFQWNSSDKNVYFDNAGQVKIGRFLGSYSITDASVSGSNPYTASASAMTDDISAAVPFVVGNTMAFSANGYSTAQNGNWATASTWVGGIVPPANSVCMILHHVTVNTVLNDAIEVDIYENTSVTFQASGELTVNGFLTNHGMLKTEDATASVNINGTLNNTNTASVNMIGNGTLNFASSSIFTNDGSFTAGTGTVDFAGDGTASGTLVFNNLNISGNVDLGTSASLNNILELSGGGNLTNNSIAYSTGSTLRFDQDYVLGDNKVWYRNVDADGNSQVGIPWNVEIPLTRTVDISDGFFRAINGNMTIDGQFDLSTTAGGDFKIRGNFINNGTLTHNSRSVEFYGNGSQNISGSVVTDFAYLKINSVANVTLEKNCNIINNIDFGNGNIILGAFDLSLNTGATITNFSNTKYVVTNDIGYLIQNINTSSNKFYPIGTLSGYNPANLSQGASATQDDISVRVNNSIDNTIDDPTQVVNMQWTINEAVATGNDLTTQFYWNLTDEAGSFNRGGTLETRYFSGTYLPNPPSASTLGGANPYDATSNGADVYTGSLSNLPFIVANSGAFSVDIISNGIGGGNWNSTTSWQGGVIPVSGNSAIIKAGDVINLDISPSVKSISIQATGTLNCTSQTITLDNGGAISNSGIFNANTGKVIFSGTGSISSGTIAFNDADLGGAVSFGSSTTIGGILSINTGGSVNINAPIYGINSTLKYNSGGSYNRGSEWQYNISEGDPGYPANVQISNNTTLDVDADNNDDAYYQTRFLSGNLTIDLGSEITLSDMGGGTAESENCGVYAKGNIINNGTITLSTEFGGDMMLEGDIINTGSVTWNNRAIFFTGENNTDQNITGLTEIPFILITRGANVILQNSIAVNGSGNEFITFARPSSINTGSLDLNGNTLTCTGDGNIELNDISGAEVTSSVAGGRIEVTGGNATYSGIGSGTLNFGTTSNIDVTLAINGGSMTFPSTLGIVTIYGTFEIGDGATIQNIPTYGNNSTLHYKKGGSYTVDVEWGPGSNVADNIPKNVTVSEGASAGVINMNANRHALGILLVENNATLEVADATGQLTVNDLTVDLGGSIILKSPPDNGVAGSLITTGTVSNSGTMQAERYISGGKYTYVSPPNANTNSQLFTNNPSGNFNPNFYSYNQAFEAPSDPATGTYAEWETDVNQFKNAWVEAHDGEGNSGIILDAATGYAYYNDINKIFVFDGTFNAGDKNVTLTYDSNDGNADYFDGWNLIANPYPSALNWDDASWAKTHVDAAVYYWDGTNSNEGNYKYYVSSGTYTDGTDVVNGGSQMIPASQAFFVKAKSSAGTGGETLTIPNDARIHSTQTFWNNNTRSGNSQFVRLQASANNTTDELVIRYISEGTENYDGQFDAYKMYSYSINTPQIYSYNEDLGAGYAINSLPISSLQNSVPIGMEIKKIGEINCTIELSDYNIANTHIYFKDNQENVTQNLILNSSYSYIIVGNSDTRGRFELFYSQNNAPVAVAINNQQAEWNSAISFTIPNNTFSDADAHDILTYEAKLSNGMSLPDWLLFDSETLTFSGNAEFVEDLEIMITATDFFGATVSQSFIFSVNAILASINTYEAENISLNSATIGSLLNSNGGEALSTSGICWNTSGNPIVSNDNNVETYVQNEFSSELTNLQHNTTYFARSYAENSVGLVYGNEISFTTLNVGIVFFENEDFSLYPNPAKEKLYISTNKTEVIKISIADISGKLVKVDAYIKGKDGIEINIEQFKAGVYFIEILTEESTYSEKFIVE